jgi:hypothetical protein
MSVSDPPGHARVIDSWQTINCEVRYLLSHAAYDPSRAAELSATLSDLDSFFCRFAHLAWSSGLGDEMMGVVRGWQVLTGLLQRDNFGPKIAALQRVFRGYLSVYRMSPHVDPEDTANFAQFCAQLAACAPVRDIVERIAFGLGLLSGVIEKITETTLDGVHSEADATMRKFAQFGSDVGRADDLVKLMERFIAVQSLAEAFGAELMGDMVDGLRVATERGEEMVSQYRREAFVLRRQAEAVTAMRPVGRK